MSQDGALPELTVSDLMKVLYMAISLIRPVRRPSTFRCGQAAASGAIR